MLLVFLGGAVSHVLRHVRFVDVTVVVVVVVILAFVVVSIVVFIGYLVGLLGGAVSHELRHGQVLGQPLMVFPTQCLEIRNCSTNYCTTSESIR